MRKRHLYGDAQWAWLESLVLDGLEVVLYELFHQPGEASVKKTDKAGLIYRKP
ncbi:hypothetical protein [Massilia sp. TSP1-1-2]|uniref:hypothetical protein n=1 Tax=unclassified Massilia TaxID=2609279 RepID=UPI003CEAB5A1